MKMMKMFAVLSLALIGTSLAATAQEQNVRKEIQKRIESEYAVTRPTDDKTDIVTAGSVLTLRKDKLIMSAVGNSRCGNYYRDGKLSPSGGCKASAVLGKLGMFSQNAKPATTRAFVSGEKFWLTKIEVRDAGKDSGVYMEFFSDAINDTRFESSLLISFSDGVLPSPEVALKLVRDVVTVPDEARTNQPEPVPAEAAPAMIPPPPPPPDAPAAEPPTVALGQTTDQVVAVLGPPLHKAKIGPKDIYTYKDLKVTFLNGKVKDIQ